MHFVSHDGTINTNANYMWSCPYAVSQYRYEEIRVCQKQDYFAIYWKLKDYVKFLKNQKIQQRIVLKRGDFILSAALNGFIQAFLCQSNLKVYFKQKKLITKCANRNYNEQITLTNDNQIILKGKTEYNLTSFDEDTERYTMERGQTPPFQIYNFVTKSFTNCNVGGGIEVYHEYCPINDVILMPTGNPKENQISVWGVSQRQVINQISVQGYLCDFEIKMNCSGQYFFIRDHRLNVLYIYSYGKKVILQKKISNLKMKLDRSWNIEWFLDHQYFLLHSFFDYKILQNNHEIVDCQLQKQNAQKGKQQIKQTKNEGNKQIINKKDASKANIHIILRKRGEVIDYYSIIL